jgi:hypothetical protein
MIHGSVPVLCRDRDNVLGRTPKLPRTDTAIPGFAWFRLSLPS